MSQWIYDGEPEDNEVGRLIETISPSAQHTRYTYEQPTSAANRGLLQSVTRTLAEPGSVSTNPPRSFVTSYQYDVYSRLSQIDYPSFATGSMSVKYDFDSYGHQVKAYNGADESLVYWQLTASDQGFRIAQEHIGADTDTYRTYEPLTGRTQYIATYKGDTQIQSLGYTYDNGGNMKTRIDYVAGEGVGYGHDEIDQLRYVWGPDAIVLEQYDYDSNSNRLSNRTGLGSYGYYEGGRDWLYNAGTNFYEHDSFGNVNWRGGPDVPGGSQEIDYTRFNLPSQIRTGEGSDMATTDFAYDANFQRVVKKQGTAVTYYAGDLYQATFDGPAARHLYRVQAGGRVVAELTVDESSSSVALTTRYLHDDALGSTDTISGPETVHQAFSPFGASASGVPSAAAPYGFTGHEHDTDLGLINMRGRMYDPVAHQFLSADPFISSPGVGFNRFAYVNNSPLNYTDPSGFVPLGDTWMERGPEIVFRYDWGFGESASTTAGVAPGVDAGAGAGVGVGWGGPASAGAQGAEVTSAPGWGSFAGLAGNVANGIETLVVQGSSRIESGRTVPTDRVGQAGGAGTSARAPHDAWGTSGGGTSALTDRSRYAGTEYAIARALNDRDVKRAIEIARGFWEIDRTTRIQPDETLVDPETQAPAYAVTELYQSGRTIISVGEKGLSDARSLLSTLYHEKVHLSQAQAGNWASKTRTDAVYVNELEAYRAERAISAKLGLDEGHVRTIDAWLWKAERAIRATPYQARVAAGNYRIMDSDLIVW